MLDLRETYGIDVYDRPLMTTRPWSWLRLHILGLLSTDTRLRRHIYPPKRTQRGPGDD